MPRPPAQSTSGGKGGKKRTTLSRGVQKTICCLQKLQGSLSVQASPASPEKKRSRTGAKNNASSVWLVLQGTQLLDGRNSECRVGSSRLQALVAVLSYDLRYSKIMCHSQLSEKAKPKHQTCYNNNQNRKWVLTPKSLHCVKILLYWLSMMKVCCCPLHCGPATSV